MKKTQAAKTLIGTLNVPAIIEERNALIARVERLERLLSRFTPEYRQIINSVENSVEGEPGLLPGYAPSGSQGSFQESPEYLSMILPCGLLMEIRAALYGGAK